MIAKVLKNNPEMNAIIIRCKMPDIKDGDLVDIKKHRAVRTLALNSLYWLFCEFCGNILNMTAEEIHDGFKEAHLRVFKPVENKLWKTTQSSSTLNTAEFTEYFEKCQATAAEFGVDAGPFWVKYERYRK